jgi:hypothetical protein
VRVAGLGEFDRNPLEHAGELNDSAGVLGGFDEVVGGADGDSGDLCPHARELKQAGEKDERIWGVGAWRESPYFSNAERAALALAECVTRLADIPDAVPDVVWDDAADHYDEKELSSLLVFAAINVWNRLNAATRQPVGSA